MGNREDAQGKASALSAIRDQLPSRVLDHWPDDYPPHHERLQPAPGGFAREWDGVGTNTAGGRLAPGTIQCRQESDSLT